MSLIEMMILGFLSERSMCGYELRKKMEQLQGYTRKFSDGAIYPATNRLVEAGLISEQASIRDGRQRRVFTLLDAGRAKLIDELKSTSGFNLTDLTCPSCQTKPTVTRCCAAVTNCSTATTCISSTVTRAIR